MNKEWQPDGWETPYDKSHSYGESCPNCGEEFGTEDTMKATYNAGASAMLSAVIKWLDGKCDHRLQSSIGGFFYPDSRRDCPQCWNEFKEVTNER